MTRCDKAPRASVNLVIELVDNKERRPLKDSNDQTLLFLTYSTPVRLAVRNDRLCSAGCHTRRKWNTPHDTPSRALASPVPRRKCRRDIGSTGTPRIICNQNNWRIILQYTNLRIFEKHCWISLISLIATSRNRFDSPSNILLNAKI